MNAEEFLELVCNIHGSGRETPQPLLTHVRDIYEDDGRGNIRDFVLGRGTCAKQTVDLIYDRASGHVVNFRIESPRCTLEQVPWHEEAQLQFIGENSTQYRLRCDDGIARAVVSFFVEIERQGLEGYKTEEEKHLDPRRVEYILSAGDPYLVLHRFNKTEYASGLDEALRVLERDLRAFPEFARSYLRTAATFLKYRNHPRLEEYERRAAAP